jgi:hypothetical protein
MGQAEAGRPSFDDLVRQARDPYQLLIARERLANAGIHGFEQVVEAEAGRNPRPGPLDPDAIDMIGRRTAGALLQVEVDDLAVDQEVNRRLVSSVLSALGNKRIAAPDADAMELVRLGFVAAEHAIDLYVRRLRHHAPGHAGEFVYSESFSSVEMWIRSKIRGPVNTYVRGHGQVGLEEPDRLAPGAYPVARPEPNPSDAVGELDERNRLRADLGHTARDHGLPHSPDVLAMTAALQHRWGGVYEDAARKLIGRLPAFMAQDLDSEASVRAAVALALEQAEPTTFRADGPDDRARSDAARVRHLANALFPAARVVGVLAGAAVRRAGPDDDVSVLAVATSELSGLEVDLVAAFLLASGPAKVSGPRIAARAGWLAEAVDAALASPYPRITARWAAQALPALDPAAMEAAAAAAAEQGRSRPARELRAAAPLVADAAARLRAHQEANR